MPTVTTLPFDVEQKIKRYCNEAYPQYCEDPEYDLTWEEQFNEFRVMYLNGQLSDEFLDFAIGDSDDFTRKGGGEQRAKEKIR